ncbi:MAG: DUF4827 family protein [Paludibacter sp.]|nr:DUF4827 family protein [Paludibacter sp.]MDD4199520.1 DUF4827 family protein [Paludibacter sp.]MDD4428374.1 DUF4827 family protein [Paludibacter sp.]
MKHLHINFFFALVVTLIFVACKDDNVTYAEELKAEQELIDDFISRQNILLVTEMPATVPWPDKVFYHNKKTGLYYRLTNRGDFYTKDSVLPGDIINTRYDQYTLDVKSDTISYHSTVNLTYPLKFRYMDYSQACKAWHEAVGYMKYNNAEAQLIIPSKIGFSTFSRPATPIAYDIKIRIQKY